MNLAPVLDTSDTRSRSQEEGRVVSSWLQCLRRLMDEPGDRKFRAMMDHAAISWSDFEQKANLTHAKLDQAISYIRRERPGIVLEAYQILSLSDFGILGYAAVSSGTIHRALDLMGRYHELTSDLYSLQILDSGDHVAIRPVPSSGQVFDAQFIAEDCLGGMWRTLGLLSDDHPLLRKATARFSYRSPTHASQYSEFFDCRLEFEADRIELRIPIDLYKMAVTTANTTMADACTSLCERILGPSRMGNTANMVRRLLLNRPGERMLKLEEAASELRMSSAQLRKRLYRANTSYKHLVLEVRMALAVHYLTETALPIQEISYLLDYSHPGAFSRAFKSYHGHPPIALRPDPL